MANPRFVLILAAAAVGFGSLGCSPSRAPGSTPAAVEGGGAAAVEASDDAESSVRWWRDDSIVAELGLTDDQIDAVEELMAASTREANEQRQKERRMSVLYLRALAQEPYDAALVDRTGEQLVDVLSNEHRRRIDSVRAVRDILSRDQWVKLWDVAPRALQVGRFRVARGRRVSVAPEPDASPTPLP